jgi:hypothetical protein
MKTVQSSSLLCAACAALVCAACGAGDRAGLSSGGANPRSHWATRAELTWIGRFGHWQQRQRDGALRFNSAYTRVRASGGHLFVGEAVRKARPFEDCRRRLDRVGIAPSPRLGSALALARQGCEKFVAFGRSLRTSRRTVIVFGTLSNVASRRLQSGWRLLDRAVRRAIVGADRPLSAKDASYVDSRLGKVAGVIARKRIEARCWSASDWSALTREIAAAGGESVRVDFAGFAWIAGSSINLAPRVCRPLRQLENRPDDRRYRQHPLEWARAVSLVAHEAEHAFGIENEAETECYAIQRTADAAESIGVPSDLARRFARAIWARYDEEPAGYSSSECRDGGAFDLLPNRSIWP